MDEVIYEEFKGTGNMEIHLERKIAEKRIYPAINIRRSGTRREDLLTSDEELQRMWVLRKILDEMEDAQGIQFLIDRLKSFKILFSSTLTFNFLISSIYPTLPSKLMLTNF